MPSIIRSTVLLVLMGIAAVSGIAAFHWVISSDLAPDQTFTKSTSLFPVTLPLGQRPDGPPRVALQVGHWKNNELPDELKKLRERGGGARGEGKAEWEVNLDIAQRAADLLRQRGVVVELLPATVPPDYWADVFVSIHADGNKNPAVSGYKVASPWRDTTGKADELTTMLKREYGAATDLAVDPNVTRNMRGYYAFNWRRYEHSIHPMTVATIIETGFLTSPHDQHTIIHNADESAHGIANGIKVFLINQELLLE